MKPDLFSQGSFCLEASANEAAEAQVNVIWSLDLCRKMTFSCSPSEAHFPQLRGCDLTRYICFRIAVSEQGQNISQS